MHGGAGGVGQACVRMRRLLLRAIHLVGRSSMMRAGGIDRTPLRLSTVRARSGSKLYFNGGTAVARVGEFAERMLYRAIPFHPGIMRNRSDFRAGHETDSHSHDGLVNLLPLCSSSTLTTSH